MEVHVLRVVRQTGGTVRAKHNDPMRVLDPGHYYNLPNFTVDGKSDFTVGRQLLYFLKRSGGAVEHDSEHAGTNVQSVIHILIHRTKYLDSLVPCIENADALYHLRMVLVAYEGRAYRRKLDKVNRDTNPHHSFRERDRDLPFDDLGFKNSDDRSGIENLPVGDDGHIIIPE